MFIYKVRLFISIVMIESVHFTVSNKYFHYGIVLLTSPAGIPVA